MLTDGIRQDVLRTLAYDPVVWNVRGAMNDEQLQQAAQYAAQNILPETSPALALNLLQNSFAAMNALPTSDIAIIQANTAQSNTREGKFDAVRGISTVSRDYLNRLISTALDPRILPTVERAKANAAAAVQTLQTQLTTDQLTQLATAQNTPFDPGNFNDPGYVQKAFIVKKLAKILPNKTVFDRAYVKPGTAAAFYYDVDYGRKMRQIQQRLLQRGISLGQAQIGGLRRVKGNVNQLVPQFTRGPAKLSVPDMDYFKNNYRAPMWDRKQKLSNFNSALGQSIDTLLNQGKTQQFIVAKERQKIQKGRLMSKLSQFDKKQDQLSNPATIWPQAVSQDVVWNEQLKKWTGITKLGRRFLSNPDPVKGYAKRQDLAQYLLKSSLTPQTARQQLPTLLNQLVKDNQAYSKFGIGPVSKNGLSLFVGRYYDPVTARVRVLPPANRKMVNKLNWGSMNQYYIVRTMNKWNQYVQAQQDYQQHQTVKASYNQKMAEREAKKMAKVQSGDAWEQAYDAQERYWLNYLITPRQMLPYYKAALKPSLQTPINRFIQATSAQARQALTAFDTVLYRLEGALNGGEDVVTRMFPDNFVGQQNKLKAQRWLLSQSYIVPRKVAKLMLDNYKATFNINNANSQQIMAYRQKLKVAQSMLQNISSDVYDPFTLDPTAVGSLDDILSKVGMAGSVNRGENPQNIAAITYNNEMGIERPPEEPRRGVMREVRE